MQKEKRINKILKFYIIVIPREMKKVRFPSRKITMTKEAQNFIFQMYN